jgi:hypothetical protein
MGKKKVAVSLRKPPSVDPQAIESFVVGDADERSVAFVSTPPTKVKQVEILHGSDGTGIDARVALASPPPPSDLLRTEGARAADASPGATTPKVAANDVGSTHAVRTAESKDRTTPGMRTLTLHIPERIAARLDVYCREQGKDMGGLVAELVGSFLDGQHAPQLASPGTAIRVLSRWIRFQIARILRAAYVPTAA